MLRIARLHAALGVLALACATPLAAQEDLPPAEAEARLDTCLSTGAPGAPRTNLLAAIHALKALCKPQIDRVLEHRLAEVDARFGLPGARLTWVQHDEHEKARTRAKVRLNDEIAVAVSAKTGLRL